MYVRLWKHQILYLRLIKVNRRLIIRDDASAASKYVADYIVGTTSCSTFINQSFYSSSSFVVIISVVIIHECILSLNVNSPYQGIQPHSRETLRSRSPNRKQSRNRLQEPRPKIQGW